MLGFPLAFQVLPRGSTRYFSSLAKQLVNRVIHSLFLTARWTNRSRMILCHPQKYPQQRWRPACVCTVCPTLGRGVIKACSEPLVRPVQRSAHLPAPGVPWGCQRGVPRRGAALKSVRVPALHCAGLSAPDTMCCCMIRPITRRC